MSHSTTNAAAPMPAVASQVVARVFVGETQGTVFPAEAMTPEAVLAAMGRIMATQDMKIPANSDRSGAPR